ncbi:MAG: type II secretion system protein GspJ [Myxococcota bacterium]|jgi:general secretion pathway protein J
MNRIVTLRGLGEGRVRRQSGMMLIEVLVALAILSLITTLVYGSISRSTEAKDVAERITARYSTARVALSRMAREISMAFLSTHISQDRRTITLFKSKNELPVDSLLFSSMAHMRLSANSHESDQSYIWYYGDDCRESPGKKCLMRREKPRLDDMPEEEGPAEVLAEDIVELEIKYWDDQQREWVDEWDTTGVEKANRLPRIVRIAMTILDEAGKEVTITTKTRVYMDKPLGF